MSVVLDLKSRLVGAQDEIAKAIEAEQFTDLPALVAKRQNDIVALATAVKDDSRLRDWAAVFLARDRELMASASAARDEARVRLQALQSQKAAQRIYLSQGARR